MHDDRAKQEEIPPRESPLYFGANESNTWVQRSLCVRDERRSSYYESRSRASTGAGGVGLLIPR